MPFTPAHATAVIPFLKNRHLSATALVIGSIAPDFEYFFKMNVSSDYSHTLAGMFYFDLPVTFGLAWLFLSIVRHNLMANLPGFVQERLPEIIGIDVKEVLRDRWVMFTYSALLGTLSHIVWDGFTHNNTFFVKNLAFYEGAFVPYEGVNYPLWYALQHISTIIGLMILIVYLLSRSRQTVTRISRPKVSYWILIILITAMVIVLRFSIHSSDLKEGNVVVTGISGCCIALVLCGLINFNNTYTDADRKDG